MNMYAVTGLVKLKHLHSKFEDEVAVTDLGRVLRSALGHQSANAGRVQQPIRNDVQDQSGHDATVAAGPSPMLAAASDQSSPMFSRQSSRRRLEQKKDSSRALIHGFGQPRPSRG